MSVCQADDKVILDGDCPVEDAERLLELLQTAPGAVVDWTGCTRLHTAVAQVVLAAGAEVAGPCGDGWIRQWLESARSQPYRCNSQGPGLPYNT